jgi:hypothetical protein
MRIFELKLPLIKTITIDIYDDRLADFTSRQLKNYIIKKNNTRTGRKYRTDIAAESKSLGDKISIFLEKDKTLARKIFVNNHILYNFNSKYEIKNNNFTIKSSKRISLIRRIYTQVRGGTYAFYHSLFYELVLFPLFSLYCIYDGYCLLHGSLLKFNNKYIAVLGLDGVGKTSFSGEITKKGGNILADNFILYNGECALPFNIAMRLEPDHETSLETLYRDNDTKEILPPVMESIPVIIDKFFILTINNTFIQRKITANNFIVYAFLNNAPEVGGANNFIAPFLYMNMGYFTYTNDPINVTLLGIPKGKIQEGVKKILSECQIFC